MVHPIFTQAETDLQQLKNENAGNTVLALADIMEDDLSALQSELEKRHIRLGKLAGYGGMALVFELENVDGRKVESALIRIEPAGSTTVIKSPAAIKPILKILGGEMFEANIVPKGKTLEANEIGLIKKSLAVLHAEGKLSELHDVNNGQFLMLPDINVPVYADINGLTGNGGIAQYAKDSLPEILQNKASATEVAILRAAQYKLDAKVREDIEGKGITIGDKTADRGERTR